MLDNTSHILILMAAGLLGLAVNLAGNASQSIESKEVVVLVVVVVVVRGGPQVKENHFQGRERTSYPTSLFLSCSWLRLVAYISPKHDPPDNI